MEELNFNEIGLSLINYVTAVSSIRSDGDNPSSLNYDHVPKINRIKCDLVMFFPLGIAYLTIRENGKIRVIIFALI